MDMRPIEFFNYCPHCGSHHFLDVSEKSKKCNECGFEYFFNASAAVACFIVTSNDELIVTTRALHPAKDTFDLPGGFVDVGENAEEAVCREVLEETGLSISPSQLKYLFSKVNVYPFSGIDVHTVDLFYECRINSPLAELQAGDDASGLSLISLTDICPELFGLQSVSEGVSLFLQIRDNK